MDSDYSQVVSGESLERELNRVRIAAAGLSPGVFGPRSVAWQIDRESARSEHERGASFASPTRQHNGSVAMDYWSVLGRFNLLCQCDSRFALGLCNSYRNRAGRL